MIQRAKRCVVVKQIVVFSLLNGLCFYKFNFIAEFHGLQWKQPLRVKLSISTENVYEKTPIFCP
jgi:hypothetical protein